GIQKLQETQHRRARNHPSKTKLGEDELVASKKASSFVVTASMSTVEALKDQARGCAGGTPPSSRSPACRPGVAVVADRWQRRAVRPPPSVPPPHAAGPPGQRGRRRRCRRRITSSAGDLIKSSIRVVLSFAISPRSPDGELLRANYGVKSKRRRRSGTTVACGGGRESARSMRSSATRRRSRSASTAASASAASGSAASSGAAEEDGESKGRRKD
ncbi:Os03g0612201, partial [Oryza sativa Japonica Group]